MRRWDLENRECGFPFPHSLATNFDRVWLLTPFPDGYAGDKLATGTPFLFDWINKNGPAPKIAPRVVSVDILESIAVACLEVAGYRYRIFDGDAISRLRAIFTKVCIDFEAELAEMDGQDNHVHLLVHYPPKHSLSTLVNSLKGVSSRLLRLERPDLVRRYWKGVLWSPSYFAASCGGAPIGILKAYIEQQKTPL